VERPRPKVRFARLIHWPSGSILLGALVVVTLLATLALAPAQVRTRTDAIIGALTGWLWPTEWAWPLAVALTLVALTSPSARRRWPRPAHRILLAIGTFLGLVGLASLAAVSRPRVGLLALGVILAVGLLAARVLVVARRLAPRCLMRFGLPQRPPGSPRSG
jgi:hypothetical protein